MDNTEPNYSKENLLMGDTITVDGPVIKIETIENGRTIGRVVLNFGRDVTIAEREIIKAFYAQGSASRCRVINSLYTNFTEAFKPFIITGPAVQGPTISGTET